MSKTIATHTPEGSDLPERVEEFREENDMTSSAEAVRALLNAGLKAERGSGGEAAARPEGTVTALLFDARQGIHQWFLAALVSLLVTSYGFAASTPDPIGVVIGVIGALGVAGYGLTTVVGAAAFAAEKIGLASVSPAADPEGETA